MSLLNQMNLGKYSFHPYTDLFPMMQPEEFASLVENLKQHGLREKIWLFQDKILDGRNRYKACLQAGIMPQFRQFTGDDSQALEAVISWNLERRHLTSSQKASIGVELEDLLAELERQAKERYVANVGRPSKEAKSSQKIDMISDPNQNRSTAKAAAVLGTNRQYVSDAKKLKQIAPELHQQIKDGKVTISQAKREIKEQQRQAKREENKSIIDATQDPTSLEGVYSTIVVDPPWDWDDEGDCDQLGRSRPTYGTIPLHELLKLPVSQWADIDAHLYLWITNRSLPKGFALLDAWMFRYVTCLTWAKPYFGMGNYFRGQTEHILFGVRGSLMLMRKDASTLFSAPRGSQGHSSKPVEFYDFVESCSPGPYLEVFARGGRKGWVTWGG